MELAFHKSWLLPNELRSFKRSFKIRAFHSKKGMHNDITNLLVSSTYILAKTNANNTLKIIRGGVNTQYDQKMVRLISRSNAFPEAACVICANVRAGGEHTRITLMTTKTGLLDGLVSEYKRYIRNDKVLLL